MEGSEDKNECRLHQSKARRVAVTCGQTRSFEAANTTDSPPSGRACDAKQATYVNQIIDTFDGVQHSD